MNLTRMIRSEAVALGFSLVGITSADPLPHAAVFEDWLKQGRHGEMSYLDSPRSHECRARPGLLLPGCRSVLALGMRYPAPTPEPEPGNSLVGSIAAYAWGADYHDLLPEKLHLLVKFIESQAGHTIPNRCYTDTGPILERELAQRADLGWIGRNTCLINPHQGSYFLLAEVLLGIDLEPDPPFTADRCGTCTRCINACPTGCILPDRTLDARRCISYLTIELKGTIPSHLRPRMGSWVFGCDVCQSVCPWNHFAALDGGQAFTPRLVSPHPRLLDELALTPAGFNHKYRLTPLMRAKRRGYLRNVALALGNSHDLEAIPALTLALGSDPEPLVRGHAAWALGQIGGEIARLALEKAGGMETDPSVQSEIRSALGSS